MADIPINVRVKIDIDSQSIRQVSQRVRDAITNVAADLDINVSQDRLQRAIDTAAQGLDLQIQTANVSQSAISSIETQIERGLGAIDISSVNVANQALNAIKSQVEQSLQGAQIEPVVGFLPPASTATTSRRGPSESERLARVEEAEALRDSLIAREGNIQNLNRLNEALERAGSAATASAQELVDLDGIIEAAINATTEFSNQTVSTSSRIQEIEGPAQQISASLRGVVGFLGGDELPSLPGRVGEFNASLRGTTESFRSLSGDVERVSSNLRGAVLDFSSRLRESDEELGESTRSQLGVADANRARIRVARDEERFLREQISSLEDLTDSQRELTNSIRQIEGISTELEDTFQDLSRGGRVARQRLEGAFQTLDEEFKEGVQGPISGTRGELATPLGFGAARAGAGIGDEERQAVTQSISALGDTIDARREVARRLLEEAVQITEAAQSAGSLEQQNRNLASVEQRSVARLQQAEGTEAILTNATSELSAARLRQAREARRIENTQKELERSAQELSNAQFKAAANIANLIQGSGGRAGQTIGAIEGLDLEEQARFIELLGRQDISIQRASSSLKAHNGVIGRNLGLTGNLTRALTQSERAAFEFGKAASSAAQRFLAWAAPAAFIFRALSLLSQATDEIIRLDSATTRIAFFSPGFFRDAEGNVRDFASQLEIIQGEFNQVVQAADRTGISIQNVSEAFLELARIGQGTEVAGSDNFRDAVLALVNIEQGALSSRDAVRFLQAILQQFNLESEDAVAVSAKLFEVSRDSSFAIGELANAATRVGSAFANFQGLNVEDTIQLIGIAATQSGANVGRLSTALRQASTLAVQNAQEIEQITGIEIAASGGQLRDFSSLLEILGEIGRLSGTAAGERLIRQIADRRNVADIAALASGFKELSEDIDFNATAAERAANAQRSVGEFLQANQRASQTLANRFERLSTAVTTLVSATGFEDFLGNVVDASTRLTRFLTGVINTLREFSDILQAIVAVPIARFLGQFSRGFVQGTLGTQVIQQARAQAQAAVAQGDVQKAIETSLNAQLISKQKALEIDFQNITLIRDRAVLETQIRRIRQGLNADQLAVLNGERELTSLIPKQRLEVERVKAAQKELNALVTQELDLRLKTVQTIGAEAAAQSTVIGRLRRSIANLGRQAVAIGGIFVADQIATIINQSNEEAKENLREINVAQSAFAQAVRGAGLGAIAGGVPGLLVGAAGGAAFGGFDAISQQEEINRRIEERARLRSQEIAAGDRAIQVATKREAAQLRANRDQSRAQQDLIRATAALERLQIRIQNVGRERAEQQGLLNDLTDKQTEIVRLQERLNQRDLEITRERLALEEDIVEIRSRGQRISQAISVIEEGQLAIARTLGEDLQIPEIELRFNRARIQAEIQTIKDELDRTEFEIRRLQSPAESGRDQELRRLTRQRETLIQRDRDARLEILNSELKGSEDRVKQAATAADKQIRAWESAANNVVSAFRSVIQSQSAIASSIRREGQLATEVLQAQLDRVESSLQGTNVGANRVQEALARAQVQIIERQLQEVSSASIRQLGAISRDLNLGFLDDSEDRARNLADALIDAENSVNAARRAFVDIARIELVEAREAINTFQNQLLARENEIRAVQAAINDEIDITRRLISAKQDQIEAINERIQRETEIANRLIETPQDILNELRQVFGAAQLFEGIEEGLDLSGFVSELGQRLQGITSRQPALLRQIVQGAQAAANLGIRLAGNLSPEELAGAIARIPVFGAQNVARQLQEQRDTKTEIQILQDAIVEKFDGLITLQEGLTQIERNREAIERQNLDAERDRASKAQTTAEQAVVAQNNATIALLGFGSSLVGLSEQIPTLGDIITSANQNTADEVKNAVDVLNLLAAANPDVQRELQQIAELQTTIARLSSQTPFTQAERDELGGFSRTEGGTLVGSGRIGEAINEAAGGFANTSARLAELLRTEAALEQEFTLLTLRAGELSDELVEARTSIRPPGTERPDIERARLRNVRELEEENAKLLSRGAEVREQFRLVGLRIAETRKEQEQFTRSNLDAIAAQERAKFVAELLAEAQERLASIPVAEVLADQTRSTLRLSAIQDEAGRKLQDSAARASQALNEINNRLSGNIEGTVSLIPSQGNVPTVNEDSQQVIDTIERQSVEQTASINENFNRSNSQITQRLDVVNTTLQNLNATNIRIADGLAQDVDEVRPIEPVSIAPESLDNLRGAIEQASETTSVSLGAAAERFQQILNGTNVGVEVGDIQIEVNANVVQRIEDDGFAEALASQLAGTALEGEVETIRNALIATIRSLNSTSPPLEGLSDEAISNLTGE